MSQPTALANAKRLFKRTGLTFPSIPADLAPGFSKRSDWCFSTISLKTSPSLFEDYLNRGIKKAIRNYVVVAHAGHGINSYALHYYLVWKPLRLFLQVGWGGAYMNNGETTRKVNRWFSLAEKIVNATHEAKVLRRIHAADCFVVAASEFHGSYWQKPCDIAENGIRLSSRNPFAILNEALQWVETIT